MQLAKTPAKPAPPSPVGLAPAQQAPTPQPLVPFMRATNEQWLDGGLDASVALDDRTHLVAGGPIEIPTAGFLGDYLILVTLSGGAGTCVYSADGIFNVLSDIAFMDTNNHDINAGDISGWDVFVQNLYGGYAFAGDKRLSPNYSAPTAGGNGGFALRVPIKLGNRDGAGALANMGASHYKLRLTTGTKDDVWTTVPPTTVPTARFQGYMMAYDQPSDADMFHQGQETAPPALGTTQYWSKFVETLSAGKATFGLNRKGNLIRELIFTFRNGAGARDEATVPDTITFKWDNRTQIDVPVALLRELMWERTGVQAPAGVVALDYAHEFSGKIGDEMRDMYLRTLMSSNLTFTFSGNGAGTCEVMTNDVVVPEGLDIYTH